MPDDINGFSDKYKTNVNETKGIEDIPSDYISNTDIEDKLKKDFKKYGIAKPQRVVIRGKIISD